MNLSRGGKHGLGGPSSAQAVGWDGSPVGSLTILYDESCALCLRCRDWLLTQPCLLPVELLPSGAPEVRRRYEAAEEWLGRELIAVDDRGRAWVGPAAFLTCLWATARYRRWAYLLARPGFAPLTERFFVHVSKRRFHWGPVFGERDPDCPGATR
jgi:predicted DCC family thiol-disulfide oxidoreductase YuxK